MLNVLNKNVLNEKDQIKKCSVKMLKSENKYVILNVSNKKILYKIKKCKILYKT